MLRKKHFLECGVLGSSLSMLKAMLIFMGFFSVQVSLSTAQNISNPTNNYGQNNLMSHDDFVLFWQIIATISGFGAFGGILASFDFHFKEIRSTNGKCYGSFWLVLACMVQGIAWGAGGALTFATTAALLDKLVPFNVHTLLFMSFSSVASGFLGIKMVRLVAGYMENLAEKTFEDKFKDKTKKVAEDVTIEHSKKTEEERQRLEDIARVERNALAALNTPPNDESYMPSLLQAQTNLIRIKKIAATKREVIILLARIYRRLKRLNDGIAELRAGLSNRRRENLPEDWSDAALQYNLACYLNVAANEAEKNQEAPQKIKDLRNEAWNLILRSILLDESNLEEAMEDDDLKSLATEEGRKWPLKVKAPGQ